MQPVTPQQTYQDVNTARQQGQKLQNMYNTQANQTYGQYQNAYGNAQGAQQNLQDFTKGMQNYGNVYGQDLSSAQKMYGFDPTQLLKANQALANTNTTLANLPQAVQQQGNYYGTTAGQQAGNYANQAGNLQSVLAGQGNAVNAYQQVLAATQNQAQQQSGQQLAGQAQQLQGYQAAAQNATSIMGQAQQTLNSIEQLAQQQGGMTAQQVAAYQNAYTQYAQAQAQINSINQQINFAQQAHDQAVGGLNIGSTSSNLPAGLTLQGNPQSTKLIPGLTQIS